MAGTDVLLDKLAAMETRMRSIEQTVAENDSMYKEDYEFLAGRISQLEPDDSEAETETETNEE